MHACTISEKDLSWSKSVGFLGDEMELGNDLLFEFKLWWKFE
jgi:hypothetical protein